MQNFIEELVAEYYKSKGYFVTINYWIPFSTERQRTQNGKKQNYESQSWTDIDVLARNNNELLLIQVKATINQKSVSEKIITYFERIENFIKTGVAPDKTSSISWWSENVEIKKIVVYEDKNSPPSYKKIMEDKGIQTIYFGDYLKQIIQYIDEKKGVKEENAGMRLLHFLNKSKLILKEK